MKKTPLTLLFVSVAAWDVMLGTAPSLGQPACEAVSAKIGAAFVRRLARDTGNLIGAHGLDIDLAAGVELGVPAGTTHARVRSAIKRLWAHTENKIHRKCSDAEAAAVFPGTGSTTSEVTDALFNDYGLPWVWTMREMARPYGASCARAAIVQAGYATRDRVRNGAQRWQRYKLLVDRVCPPELFTQLEMMTESSVIDDFATLRR